jgi:hypothetical protein
MKLKCTQWWKANVDYGVCGYVFPGPARRTLMQLRQALEASWNCRTAYLGVSQPGNAALGHKAIPLPSSSVLLPNASDCIR